MTSLGTEIVLDGEYKYFDNQKRGIRRLYRLTEDPQETVDLSGHPKQRRRIQRMVTIIEQRRDLDQRALSVVRSTPAGLRPEAPPVDQDALDENREALRALGYLE